MDTVLDRRGEIYDYFHANQACQKHFFDGTHEAEYVAYYNSMYLLQDSTESLWSHRRRGFSDDPHQAYLELWGVFQAVIIQQDSIAEIFEVMTGSELKRKGLTTWVELRHLRNVCAGHPAKRDRPKSVPLTRSFLGRMFGGYGTLKYEQWEPGVGTTHPQVRLGELLDSYAVEAERVLSRVLECMHARWPRDDG